MLSVQICPPFDKKRLDYGARISSLLDNENPVPLRRGTGGIFGFRSLHLWSQGLCCRSMDDNNPATKGDIRILRGELQGSVKYLNESINQVLTVVINIEKKLDRRLDNHEQRIQVLEKVLK